MRWTRKSVRPRSLGTSRLRFERLEDRSLLAVAAFHIHLFHDDGGAVGAPITNDTVEVGEAFFAQVVAREYHPGFSGLASVFIDIAWDADVLDIVEPFDPRVAVTPNLPLMVSGTLHQNESRTVPFVFDHRIRDNVGHIDGLGGLASVSSGVGKPIGSDGDDRHVRPAFLGLSTTDDHFAWLHFRAEQAGEALFTMRQGGWGVAPLPVATFGSKHIHFQSQIVTVVEQPEPAQAPPLEHTPVDVRASGIPVGLDGPGFVVETPVTYVPEQPIQHTPEVPAQVEFVFERAAEPQIETSQATSIPVETLPIEEPDAASEEPPSSAPSVWQNADYPLDVDGTGQVRPLDVLIIANHLNINFGNWELPPAQFTPPRYLDVNGDGRATPHDALLVVNYIESRRMPEAEAEPFHASEFSETVPVSERPDHVDAALRDAVFTPDTLGSAPREGNSYRTDRPVSERQDHVDAALRDAARIAVSAQSSESQHREALPKGRLAADTVLRARRAFLASWSEIEDILPGLAADWFRQA